MELFMSKRFYKSYSNASLCLKNLAEGAVHDFVRRARSDLATVLQNYDKLAHLKETIIEIELSGSHRLLATFEAKRLILLEMGNHDVVRRYTSKKALTDMKVWKKAPMVFFPEQSEFFTRFTENRIPTQYQNETEEEWLYFLDKEQAKIDGEIREQIFKSLIQEKTSPPFFILGGPGTGKSCILLNLLHFFHSIVSTGIDISDSYCDYVAHSTQANIQNYQTKTVDVFVQKMFDSNKNSIDLLLLDDPASSSQIESALKLNKQGMNVVIAFDPLQLNEALPDAEFNELVTQYRVQTYFLNTCYRQKKTVGKATQHVAMMISRSTPFLADFKIAKHNKDHQILTTQANDVKFVNPTGYVEFYEQATLADIRKEVNRILNAEWLMWKHYPGLLAIEDMGKGYVLSDAYRKTLLLLENRNYVVWKTMDQLLEVKGLEFQHVFIFLNKTLFTEIQHGFSGSGRKIYDQRRLLRIPFSRAKDSLVTFAF